MLSYDVSFFVWKILKKWYQIIPPISKEVPKWSCNLYATFKQIKRLFVVKGREIV